MSLIELIDSMEGYYYGSDSYIKARTTVVEAVEKLERDAARYRWLRENKYIWSDFSYIAHSSKKVVGIESQWFAVEAEKNPTREHLDAAIDAAMEATNGQGT